MLFHANRLENLKAGESTSNTGQHPSYSPGEHIRDPYSLQ